MGPETSSSPPAERRLAPRVAARLSANLETVDGETVSGRTCDVGVGGICIETEAALAEGCVRRVSLELPDRPLSCDAADVWRREHRDGRSLTGIRFIDLSRHEVFRLWEFVNQRAAELAAFLHEQSSLSGISLGEAMDLALFTRVSRFAEDTWIYRSEGERSAEFVSVIYGGRVELDAVTEEGRSVELGCVGTGSVLGGLPVVAGLPHPFSARALEETLLLEIDSITFRYLERAKPDVARVVVRSVVAAHVAQLQGLVARVADLREKVEAEEA